MDDCKLAYTAEDKEIISLEIEKYIAFLFDKTDENGELILPEEDGPPDDPNEIFYRYKMNWTKEDARQLIQDMKMLVADISNIARIFVAKEDKKTLDVLRSFSEKEFSVWQKYLSEFDLTGIDEEKIEQILARYAISEDVRITQSRIEAGEEVTGEEKDRIANLKNMLPTREDREYFGRYYDTLEKQAKERIGGNADALKVITHAKKLQKLLELEADDDLIRNEERLLAKVAAVNKFATEVAICEENFSNSDDRKDCPDDISIPNAQPHVSCDLKPW